ncbi:hypothetical protein PG993_007927 [Apiospora rasikravindrae]|uniref:non-specific serine/threonine protein kinase n=1 Tax=Apiospora rasikravindrae TaxID=990691 RepID=A0ABR1T0A7_9PEZI
MSTADLRKYRQAGVFLPHYRRRRASENDENGAGSVANNRLYVNKILVRGDANEVDDPEEDANFLSQLPLSFGFLLYASGGNLEQLIDKYRGRGDQVPEHFIWHVAVELGEALKYLQRGETRNGTVTRPWPGPLGRVWPRIYHRDLVANNVFINYVAIGHSRGVRGTDKNAFPEIVLGDFGLAARNGDPAADLLPSVHFGDDPTLANHPARNTPNDWEDVHYYGGILRRLFMAHIPLTAYQNINVITPESFTVAAANRLGVPAGQTRYSNALEAWLREFEWRNMDLSPIEEFQTIGGVQSRNWSDIANVYATTRPASPPSPASSTPLLPQARTELQDRRRRMRDWTGANDVSWTKEKELMPYVYTDETDPELAGLDKWSTASAQLPQALREHRELMFMEWPVPYLAEIDGRVDVRKPRPPPPPGGGGGRGGGGGGGGGDDSDGNDDEDEEEDEEEEEEEEEEEDEDGDVEMGGS